VARPSDRRARLGDAKLAVVTQAVGDFAGLLFHYTTSSGLIGILQSGCLWATDVRFLNDTSEGQHGREVIEEALANAQFGDDAALTVLREDARAFFDPTRRSEMSSVVVCFSEQGDQLSQWRAYGAGGGFAIGFDWASLENPRRVFNGFSFFLKPVEYSRGVNWTLRRGGLRAPFLPLTARRCRNGTTRASCCLIACFSTRHISRMAPLKRSARSAQRLISR
jgi:hypothetical protein